MTLSDRPPLSGPAARSVAQDQTVVCLTPASDQCDINVGLVIEASIPRVVPPRINSRSRECPYPPMTMRSAPEPYPTIAEQLSAPEISRSPEARCGGPPPMGACERALIASPPFLSVL